MLNILTYVVHLILLSYNSDHTMFFGYLFNLYIKCCASVIVNVHCTFLKRDEGRFREKAISSEQKHKM